MRSLPRRSLLRGALGGSVAAIALPALEAMLDVHGTAHADGTPLPTIFGLWWWGCGARLGHWVPSSVGSDFALPEEVVPFTPHRDYVSLISGTSLPGIAGPPHDDSSVALLSGSAGSIAGGEVIPLAPSVDQIVANRWQGRTRIRSLELGVSRMGYSQFYPSDESLSFDPGKSLQAETSPSRLFSRLFSMGSSSHKSVLDLVSEDARALSLRVGAADRARLDQHLENIRALEVRLQGGPSCSPPVRPKDPATSSNHEPLEEINKAMADLLVLALACDLTRVFSFTFTKRKADTVFWQVGATQGIHTLTHAGPSQEEVVHRAVVFTMQQLAYLVDALKSTSSGAGNLLDRSCLIATSEVAEGYSHAHEDFPILMIGKGGGTLRGGIHYRSTSKEHPSAVLLTGLHAIGEPDTTFGTDHPEVLQGGQTSTSPSELRASAPITSLLRS